jgi:hypothetical protein
MKTIATCPWSVAESRCIEMTYDAPNGAYYMSHLVRPVWFNAAYRRCTTTIWFLHLSPPQVFCILFRLINSIRLQRSDVFFFDATALQCLAVRSAAATEQQHWRLWRASKQSYYPVHKETRFNESSSHWPLGDSINLAAAAKTIAASQASAADTFSGAWQTGLVWRAHRYSRRVG